MIGSVTDVRFQSDHLSANLVECSRTPSLRTEKISRIGKWQKSHAAKIGRNRLISFIIPNKTEFLAHCLTATAEIYTIFINLLIAVFLYFQFQLKNESVPSIFSNSDEFCDFDLVKVVFVLVHGTKDSSRDDP